MLANFGFSCSTKRPQEGQATSQSVEGLGEAREVLMKAPGLHQMSFPRSPKSDVGCCEVAKRIFVAKGPRWGNVLCNLPVLSLYGEGI